jgi:hypothetical protein
MTGTRQLKQDTFVHKPRVKTREVPVKRLLSEQGYPPALKADVLPAPRGFSPAACAQRYPVLAGAFRPAMSKKTPLSQDDKALFRQLMTGTRQLKQDTFVHKPRVPVINCRNSALSSWLKGVFLLMAGRSYQKRLSDCFGS